uniref:ATP synthase F0 subunit 8 n=1 Tax=Megaustenia imperator imperator TaxID=2979634 RepID=A0A977K7C7_9EUPU|nr:ATP synthase F0 subunit 8 [Megaustenia imperator imperator]
MPQLSPSFGMLIFIISCIFMILLFMNNHFNVYLPIKYQLIKKTYKKSKIVN